jgi:hypothetical protein
MKNIHVWGSKSVTIKLLSMQLYHETAGMSNLYGLNTQILAIVYKDKDMVAEDYQFNLLFLYKILRLLCKKKTAV